MQTVYSAPQLFMVSIARDFLESQGVSSTLQHEFLSAGVGELPPIETWPLLTVADEDFDQATRLIKLFLTENTEPDWRCKSCNELVEGSFAACWNCDSLRPQGPKT